MRSDRRKASALGTSTAHLLVRCHWKKLYCGLHFGKWAPCVEGFVRYDNDGGSMDLFLKALWSGRAGARI